MIKKLLNEIYAQNEIRATAECAYKYREARLLIETDFKALGYTNAEQRKAFIHDKLADECHHREMQRNKYEHLKLLHEYIIEGELDASELESFNYKTFQFEEEVEEEEPKPIQKDENGVRILPPGAEHTPEEKEIIRKENAKILKDFDRKDRKLNNGGWTGDY